MNWLEDFVIHRNAQRSNVYLAETFDYKRIEELKDVLKSGAFGAQVRVDYVKLVEFDLQRMAQIDIKTGEFKAATDPTQLDDMLINKPTVVIIKLAVLQGHADILSNLLIAWAHDPRLYAHKSTVIVFTTSLNLFNESFRRLVYTISIPPSTPEERKKILDKTAEDLKTESRGKYNPEVSEAIIDVTAGLNLWDVETAAFESFALHKQFKLESFAQYKRDILKNFGIMYVEPTRGFESVGGYDLLKDYIRRRIINPLRDAEKAQYYGLKPPRGILFYGYYGCGKSFFIRTLAKEIGLPELEISSADFLRGLVGESEQRVRYLTQLLESLAPAIIFIDEYDALAKSREGTLITDSTPSYTPILIRHKDMVDIIPFEDLWNTTEGQIIKLHTSEEIKILKEPIDIFTQKHGVSGWSKIKHLIRHPYEGQILRINSIGGLVDVSPNHSIIMAEDRDAGWERVKDAKNVKINDKVAMPWKPLQQNSGLFFGKEDLAWLYGFFAAEGSAYKHDSYQISFSNTNEELLKKALNILDKYIDIKPQWSENRKGHNPPVQKWHTSGKYLYQFFRENFYTFDGHKKVPAFILNAPQNIKLAFLKGYNEGDGRRISSGEFKTFTTNSQTLAAGLIWLIQATTQQSFNIQIRDDKPSAIEIQLNKNPKNRTNKRTVKKIKHLQYKGYLYDVETENHKFCGGVGPIVLHNSGTSRNVQNMLLKWLGDEHRKTIIVGATNYIEQCDPAFLRTGRIDKIILILPPDVEAREQILKVHCNVIRKVPIDKSIDFSQLAKQTYLFTGAELERLVLDAAALAMDNNAKKVTDEHFSEALKSIEVNVSERMNKIEGMINIAKKQETIDVAFLHEAVHAFASKDKEGSRLKGLLD